MYVSISNVYEATVMRNPPQSDSLPPPSAPTAPTINGNGIAVAEFPEDDESAMKILAQLDCLRTDLQELLASG